MLTYCYMFGIQKRHFNGNVTIDRCVASNNSSIVTLTKVFTVTTKGSLSSNGRTYMRREHISQVSLGITVNEERSLALTSKERSLALTVEERSRNLAAIEDSRIDSPTELVSQDRRTQSTSCITVKCVIVKCISV
jgi:hypothetical protein